MICEERMIKNLRHLATVGAEEDGGISRLAFSDADWEARKYIIGIMEEAGLAIRMDAFGNIIGRREGRCHDAAPVMMGSHIDSVPHGGNFDGIVGVLGAIEIINVLNDRRILTDCPIEVVIFMAEESSRFGMATLGSKAFCGKLTYQDIGRLHDRQEISLPEAMRKRGLVPENIEQAHYQGEIKAFFELHIEQGKVLEETETQLGIVTAIAAPTRLRIMVTGQADHSGATPMTMRQDALTAAAQIILDVESLALARTQQGIVGTTGIVKASPGVMNVIPGQVELGIDIRGTCREAKDDMLRELRSSIETLRQKRGVTIEITVLSDDEPVKLSPQLTKLLRDLCKKQKVSARSMPSGAGHDAMHLAEKTPVGMIFIPCRGGISHNPAEWAGIRDITAGVNLLLQAVLEVAEPENGYFAGD